VQAMLPESFPFHQFNQVTQGIWLPSGAEISAGTSYMQVIMNAFSCFGKKTLNPQNKKCFFG